MANYSEMTHAELATLCSKQQAHISSLNEQAVRMRHSYGQETDKLRKDNTQLRKAVYTMGEGEEAHLCMIAHLKRELDETKEQGGNYQYDLEELQTDLQPLDEFMSDLTGVCNYEDLIDYIKGIQERCETTALERDGALDDIDKLKQISVPKEILFAERQGAKDRYDIAIKQVSDLMEEVEKQKGINKMLMDAIEAKSD